MGEDGTKTGTSGPSAGSGGRSATSAGGTYRFLGMVDSADNTGVLRVASGSIAVGDEGVLTAEEVSRLAPIARLERVRG